MSETLITCPGCKIPNFTPKGLKSHKCKGPKPVSAVVVPAPAAILGDARKALDKLREVIAKYEETFHNNTLGPRLQIGLAAFGDIGQLVLQHRAAVHQQAANQRALAIVHTAAGDEAQGAGSVNFSAILACSAHGMCGSSY